MVPLVIPVSVPVRRIQPDAQGGWTQGRAGVGERPTAQSERKPSVIVARRRSLRNSMSESFGQVSFTSRQKVIYTIKLTTLGANVASLGAFRYWNLVHIEHIEPALTTNFICKKSFKPLHICLKGPG